MESIFCFNFQSTKIPRRILYQYHNNASMVPTVFNTVSGRNEINYSDCNIVKPCDKLRANS